MVINSTAPGRKRWVVATITFVVIAGLIAIALCNPRITRYVEGPTFRAELEKQTAKGLHFPACQYAPIRRTGFLSAETERITAADGRKAMTKVDAHGIRARFNPLGVFLRRWQLDELHIDGGEVGIHVYEPKPEPSPAKPWYHVFLPDRVYLKRVWSEPADVTWTLLEKKSGIFGTRLLITPHGRDFEYQATGGTMKVPHAPDLALHHTHMLITKTLFELYRLDLASGAGIIHGEGKAGMRDDKSVDFLVSCEKLPIREWVPASWKEHVAGTATGKAHWTGRDQKLENAYVTGAVRVNGGRIEGVEFLQVLAAITKRKSLETIELEECSAEVEWEQDVGQVKNIAIESAGKFRIEGAVTLRKKSLGGALQLGATREYLDWLPKAEEVFTREANGYLWTEVHLSGTLDSPQQDLSPRLLEALKETPTSFLGAMFRALGEWLDGKK